MSIKGVETLLFLAYLNVALKSPFHNRISPLPVLVVDKVRDYHRRLFLEEWHSQRDQNAGNEHKEILDIYQSLA